MNDLALVTGGAGFIGSHLVERLLADGGRVRVLDNFSTGARANLGFAPRFRRQLEVIRGDVRNLSVVLRAARGARVIFHQAAMRSVPRSVKDPLGANDNNVTGTLHVLEAARRCRVPRVVYASSSSVYGERPELPKREDQPTAPLSPYAASKAAGVAVRSRPGGSVATCTTRFCADAAAGETIGPNARAASSNSGPN